MARLETKRDAARTSRVASGSALDRMDIQSQNAEPADFFRVVEHLVVCTAKSRRNPRQHQAVLKAAARYFGTRILIATAALSLLAFGVFDWTRAAEAAKYVQSLATARIEDVPALTAKVQPYRRWANPRLPQMFDASTPDSPERLRARWRCFPSTKVWQANCWLVSSTRSPTNSP